MALAKSTSNTTRRVELLRTAGTYQYALNGPSVNRYFGGATTTTSLPALALALTLANANAQANTPTRGDLISALVAVAALRFSFGNPNVDEERK